MVALSLLIFPGSASAGIVYPEPRASAEAGPVHIDLWISDPVNSWRATDESSSRLGAMLRYYISWPSDVPRPGFEIRLTDTSESLFVIEDSWKVEPGRRRAADSCPGERQCEAFGFRVAPASGRRSQVVVTLELHAWADPATGQKESWRVAFEVVVNFRGEGSVEGSEWKLFTPAPPARPRMEVNRASAPGEWLMIGGAILAASVIHARRQA